MKCYQCDALVALSREGNPLHTLGGHAICVDHMNQHLAESGWDIKITAAKEI